MRTIAGLLLACLCRAATVCAQAQGVEAPVRPEPPEARTFVVEENGGTAVPSEGEAVARSHLARNGARYRVPAEPGDLRLERVKESILGRHFSFQQYADGIPVLHACVTVSMSHTNHAVYRVHSTALPLQGSGRSRKARVDSEAALDSAWAHLRVRGGLKSLPKADLVWIPVADGLRLGHRTEICCSDPLGTWETLIDAETGQVLSSRNRMRTDSHKRGPTAAAAVTEAPVGAPVSRAEAVAAFIGSSKAGQGGAQLAGPQILLDSVAQGTAWVFDPDPKTTLQSDVLSDASTPSAFVPAMVLRPLRDITFAAGTYRLTGPWVTISDFELPSTAPSTTTDGVWAFPRGHNGLNDAIVYFHLDQSQRYLQALGYAGIRGIQSRSIPADSDGAGGDDNSYFDPSANRVSFGHGGVDDSEDADVVLHEYGHAIEHDIEPGWGGGDTGAIGEGFGDYWAGSYSLSCSNGATFHPDWVFTWDGHNEFWAGRILNATGRYIAGRTYDAHTYVNGVLGDELWSAPLFQSLKRLLALGHSREEADTIVIESHYGMGYGTRIPAMASNVVATALALHPDGPHAGIYYSEFTNRNILTTWGLSSPRVVFPPGGEYLVTGAVRHIRWAPASALVPQGAVVEFLDPDARFEYWRNNVEGGAAGWTVRYNGGTKNWQRVTTTNHSPVSCWWANEQTVKARMYLVSPSMVLSNGVIFSFWHQFSVQPGYDGGVVEISTNGGVAWVDVTTNVLPGGYSTLSQINPASNNPIRGRMAFSGSSGGFVRSFIDLGRYGGKTVKLRFCMATDSSIREAAPRGWWVDDMVLEHEAWESVGTAGPGVHSIAWTPLRAMTAAVVRVKATAPGCADSAWATSRVFSVSVDVDADGLPDAWETANFGSTEVSSGVGDSDGDGSSDYAEWIAGTSPTQDVSVLRMTDAVVQGTGTVSVGWASATGRCYAVEWTSDPVAQPFAAAISNVLATPATNRVGVQVGEGANGVVRVRVDP